MNHPHHTGGNYTSPTTCRAEYEASYTFASSPPNDHHNNNYSPTRRHSAMSTLTSNTLQRDPLHAIHGHSSRINKHCHHSYPSSPGTYIRQLSPEGTARYDLPPVSPRRASNPSFPTPSLSPSASSKRPMGSPQRSLTGPRSDRLPSLFDRIKAALEAPKRPTITTSPLPNITSSRPIQYGSVSYVPPETLYDDIEEGSNDEDEFARCDFFPSYSDNDNNDNNNKNNNNNLHLAPATTPLSPTLFGLPCSEAGQRAYSDHSAELEKSFSQLQQEDSGKVEYRTIAFSTHLTVSRWEPVTSSLSSTSPLASKTSSPSSSPPLTNKATTILPSKNDPVLASKLMSLANYIRHIVSLTSGNTPLHTQPLLVTPPKTVPTPSSHFNHTRSNVHDISLPSPLSTGPGPIKAESSLRRHRFSAGYQGHHTRRQSNSHHAHVMESNVPYHLPSPISPSFLVRHGSSQPSSTKAKFSPLLKIPYPNLTLTLALIYVDRLKAKYPEARGEPGCSHRLFLVAYIIAAKYRCSVELAGMLQKADCSGASETNSEAGDDINNNNKVPKSELEAQNQQESWDYARSKAQMILSNHEWVRLLRLGSFFRPPIAPTTEVTEEALSTTAVSKGATPVTARTSPAQPMVASSICRDGSPLSEPKPLPIQSRASQSEGSTPEGVRRVSTSSHASSSILQVEDLDRMETEFLTFLDFDLSTRSQDLNTCWNLLVGEQ
ncbi:hypothetical protein MVEG_01849 [Podila verticillata NRRL 6337]|nr:hypothetical protein MVEG_01849 [Podila verticillata NRRL 6337]